MSFGKMPMANGFFLKKIFNKEFFYNLKLALMKKIFYFKLNHPKSTKFLIISIPFLLINLNLWLIILKNF